jgi:hypothetical protein
VDIHEVAEILAGPAPALRFRQGTVVSVQADGTFTATIAGSTISVSAIKPLAHVCPCPGHGIWLATDGVDLFGFGTMGAIGPAFCSVRPTSGGSIADTTDTAVDFSGGGVVIGADTHGMYSGATPTQITVVVPGVYLLVGDVSWAGNATGIRSLWITAAGVQVGRSAIVPTGSGNVIQNVTATVTCNAGDALCLYVRQSSGSPLVIGNTAYSPGLTATWLRSHP